MNVILSLKIFIIELIWDRKKEGRFPELKELVDINLLPFYR